MPVHLTTVLATIALTLTIWQAVKVRFLSRCHFGVLAPAALRWQLRLWRLFRRRCALVAFDVRKMHDGNAVLGYGTIVTGTTVAPETALAHFRRAIAVQRSCAEPTPVDDCAVLFELALTDPCALAGYLRVRSDHQREQLAWRYAAWLKDQHGIERLPAYLLRGWAALLVSTAASGAA